MCVLLLISKLYLETQEEVYKSIYLKDQKLKINIFTIQIVHHKICIS